jgi:MerR family redox-sensitive transcriptional activator SoxR
VTSVAELAIGQVADATGIAVSVIRYYDEVGLITPARRVGGKRRFEPDVVERLGFVRRAKDAGFSLDDIKKLLDPGSSDWPAIVDHHLTDLRQQREQLDVVACCPRVSSC